MISIEQLRKTLTVNYQYQLLLFVDLATVLDTPTQLYHAIKTVYRQEYLPEQRLVFYTSQEIKQPVLEHLHQCLSLLNISSFFCLVCTSYNIAVDHFDDPVSVLKIDLEPTTLIPDSFLIPSSFCPLPWMHLEIKHNGDLYPCCVYESSIGSSETGSLQDTLENSSMVQLRKEFMQGERPSGCTHCWKLEDQGLKSNRQWHVKQYSQKFYEEYFDNIKIRSLDIKPGNVCNFKCRICNPTNSSLFADEARNLIQKSVIPIDSFTSARSGRWVEYNDYVWNELKNLLPDIENLDFYGGEPFLVKQIPELLTYAVTQGHAEKIKIHFNSNGSVFPEKLIPILLKFKTVDITLSIDNIGRRFELERGGSWQDVSANILKFMGLRSNKFEVYLMPTVNIQNVYYLDELLSWAAQHQIRVTLNFLDRPSWANIDQLTDAGKKLIVDKYINSQDENLKNIAQRVMQSVGSDGRIFVKRMKQFDSVRQEDFSKTHPEMAQAMGY